MPRVQINKLIYSFMCLFVRDEANYYSQFKLASPISEGLLTRAECSLEYLAQSVHSGKNNTHI